MSLYKCTDCFDVAGVVHWLNDDETPVSECCAAPAVEVKRKHSDGCCCPDCDPSGIVQSYYGRTGRVL